jgi:hypothetical protein
MLIEKEKMDLARDENKRVEEYSAKMNSLISEWDKIYDTHEHWGFYWDYSSEVPLYSLRNVFNGAYLGMAGIDGNDYEAIYSFLKNKRGADILNSLRNSFIELHGIDIYPLNPKTLEELDKKIQTSYNGPQSMYDKLREYGKVEKIVMDIPPHLWDEWNNPMADMTIRIDDVIFPFQKVMYNHYLPVNNPKQTNQVEKYCVENNLSLDSLDDFEEGLDEYILSLRPDATVVKIGTAYQRTLHFTIDENEDGGIDKIYEKIKNKKERLSEHEMERWGNYIVTILMGFATAERMPVQIHTGLATMKETDPRYLMELIGGFPGVQFDLFHGGYPYHNSIPGILFTKPNVHVDLCWMPILSQQVTRILITELVELGVWNRVNAYGGDCQNLEGSYGALLMAKEALAEALLDLVRRGTLIKADAIDIGQNMLYDNPKNLFG